MDEDDKAEAGKYETFWKEFGRALKLGIIEDAPNRPRLAKLLRVTTSADPSKQVSLDDYIERMKPDQKQIFYLTGALAYCLVLPCFVSEHPPCLGRAGQTGIGESVPRA